MFKAKNRVFEFVYQKMNTFEPALLGLMFDVRSFEAKFEFDH